MKKNDKIQNIQDLHLEILRLKSLAASQEEYLGTQYQLLKAKVEAPARIFNNVMSYLPGGGIAKRLLTFSKDMGSHSKNQNLISKILRFGTSAAIDRLFLRKAGVLKRLIVGLLSQQAVGLIDKNLSNNLIQKVTDWIRPKPKKSKPIFPDENQSMDFGIPPDSETY